MLSHEEPSQRGPLLADLRAERAACGTGFIAHLSGQPTNALLRDALEMLNNLAHRGAQAADGKTGDGAGILTQIPYTFFARELAQRNIQAPPPGDLGVGVFFMDCADVDAQARTRQLIADALQAEGLSLLAWRSVPVNLEALGAHALKTRPHIEQALIARGERVPDGDAFERALTLARRASEKASRAQSLRLYVPSLSARTLVYKGLFVSPQLAPFYADLRDPLYETALALFHQRYSTNTFPNWERAQPFRALCHNGEINTLQGNIAWMHAREPQLASPVWGERIRDLLPIVDRDGSDSAMLDNVLELLAQSGRSLPHAMLTLVPEAWENVTDMPETLRDFYRFHSTLMEPWDGPAALAFSDGRLAGMMLDRNGLRPARFLLTGDGLVCASSEAGALEVDPARVTRKGKLGPGQMLVADLTRGCVLTDAELKAELAARKPYGQWASARVRRHLDVDTPASDAPAPAPAVPLARAQAAFGYTDEELIVVLRPMAEDGTEPTGSMGDDTPHAVLSNFERPLYQFFKQRFAEVTNPPIDPLRETLVMSQRVLLGARANLLADAPDGPPLLELDSPFITDGELARIRTLAGDWPQATLDATFDVGGRLDALQRALDKLCVSAEHAVAEGATILIISDRNIGEMRAPIPMLLAVSAVHHHLLQSGQRMQASLIAEAGDAREVHHLACLIGYGADAVNPYLALAGVRSLVDGGSRVKGLTAERAGSNFIHAAEKGLLKIMSKMGIATLDAYHGAQVFESIGMDGALIERYFPGTPCPVDGLKLSGIARITLAHHAHAFADGQARLKSAGFFKYKKHGEYHAMNPELVGALHAAVRVPGALNGNFQLAFNKYRDFAQMVESRPATDLSDHVQIEFGNAVPLNEVEPATELVRRFSTAAMSHGSLSLEAHKAIAIATGRLGALSNSGEGGEDPARYGTESNSPIKQVASARFGVTPAYLMSADELQIKMAQGSKPGEGGQLPAHKVSAEIAAIRHTSPGIALISPPPHHDIYSIEDLAQLIYDLKRINPRAKVSVKLVSQAGVGTITAGVAKARADVIHISGHSGGTGASPLSSIKNAGSAWELGLAEVQQVLVSSELRGRVRVRVDGGFKTARHVIVGALLGADEFSFGTAAIVAGGCIMARVCHLNTCPTGIATQRADLREKFPDVPEWIMAYLMFVAEETRGYLASLGYRTLGEATGHVERLTAKRPQKNSRAVIAARRAAMTEREPALV